MAIRVALLAAAMRLSHPITGARAGAAMRTVPAASAPHPSSHNLLWAAQARTAQRRGQGIGGLPIVRCAGTVCRRSALGGQRDAPLSNNSAAR